ncbi:MAG: winged helix-turn-helix domain-containing protein, partial [Sarcina sp.]
NVDVVNCVERLKKILFIDQLSLIVIDSDSSFIEYKNLLKYIRSKSEIPIIIITYVESIFEKILAFDMGVDDYIIKPFDIRELVVRSRAVIRRYTRKEKDRNDRNITFKNLKVDYNSYKVIYKDKELKMPPKEFELLYYLVINSNKVFTREELLHKIWGYKHSGDSRTVDVHIKRIREKLGNNREWALITVWGIGYKFEVKNVK